MDVEFVPIAISLSIALVVIMYYYFRFRTRQEHQQTVRAVVDKGVELTPEVLDRLGEPKPRRNADLRRGIVGAGIGAGFAVFGLILGEDDAVRPLIAVGAFPFMIGLAYLGLWKFRES